MIVLFLGLFICVTLVLGVAALFRRIRSSCFALFAASDLFLALAVTAQQRATASWALPAPGEWAPLAAALLGVAAIVRLGSMRTENRLGPALVGWSQGAALAWWAGSSAPVVLIIGGLALWGTCALGRTAGSRLNYLTVAGGLIALVSAAGGSATAIAVAALAGVAGLMGERTVSTFALALAPLSLITTIAVPFGPPAILAAVLLPAAALAAGPHFAPPPEPPAPASAHLVAAAAALGGIFLLDAGGIVWLMFATGAAAAAVFWLTRPSPVMTAAARPEFQAPARSWPALIAGWILMGLALLVGASLAIYGFGTSFL